MLGLIYGHLPAKEDRHNFAHSCKAVHSAPDVLHRITSLTLHLADATPAEAVAAVAHFPAGAVLKRLVLRAGSSAGGGLREVNALPTLRAFDEAAGSNAHVPARLQEVETLRMEVCVMFNTRKASSGGGRGACYTMAAVRVDEFGSKEARFEAAFSHCAHRAAHIPDRAPAKPEHLTLHSCTLQLTPWCLDFLPCIPLLAQIQGFKIEGNGAVALAFLLRLLLLNLTELELDEVQFSSQLLAPLCAGTAPIKLQELCIRECKVDSQLLPALGLLQHLRMLHLEGSSLYGEHDVSPLAQLRGLQELNLNSYGMEPLGLSSVLSACTQLRVLTVPCAHHITPELCSTSLTMLTARFMIISKPFLLDFGLLPSLRALHALNIILCEDVEQGRLPLRAVIVEQNARMLSSLPATVKVEFGHEGEPKLCLFGVNRFLGLQESGDVVEALLGRLGPLATLQAARGLHDFTLDDMHILPGSISALVHLFPGLRILQLGSGEDEGCILSPQALFEACVRFPVLERLTFSFREELSHMVFAACGAYVQSKREGQGGSLLKLFARLPRPANDQGRRAAFEGLQSDVNATLANCVQRCVDLCAWEES